jgi:formate dehydrogenase subunit delta
MDHARLVHMVNQIAKNFAVEGEDAAVAATAQHLRDFWDPRMKAAILKCNGSMLSPIAAQAVLSLEE